MRKPTEPMIDGFARLYRLCKSLDFDELSQTMPQRKLFWGEFQQSLREIERESNDERVAIKQSEQ